MQPTTVHSQLAFLRGVIPTVTTSRRCGIAHRVVVVLLLELHNVLHLQLGLLLQALGAQSEQLLQAVDEALVEPLQLLAAPHPLTLAADASQSAVQVVLQVGKRDQKVRCSVASV